jgi:hypothetical protein
MKRKAGVFIAVVIALFFLASAAIAMEDYDAYTYVVPYNQSKTVAWSPPDAATVPNGYEWYFLRMDSGVKVSSGTVTAPSLTVSHFRTHGVLVIYVRPFWIVNGVKQFGEWGNSLDSSVGVVNGQPHAWVIYVLQQQ